MKTYGHKPSDLGYVDLNTDEMMFWMYCPVKLMGQDVWTLPDTLQKYEKLLEEVNADFVDEFGQRAWEDNYIYMTAKTLWVSADNPGNRPGWHSDGFMTDDLNYLWYDANPTLFWEVEKPVWIIQHHKYSLEVMDLFAEAYGRKVTYPVKHLLRLDETVIHRVNDVKDTGMRTFIKISVSKEKYDLKGNSINYKLPTSWNYRDRSEFRNPPSQENK